MPPWYAKKGGHSVTTKKLSLRKLFLEKRTERIIAFIASFVFIYSLLASGFTTKKYNLSEGDIAKADIKAPRDAKDELSTEAKIQQAINAVPIQYNKKPEVKTESLNKLNDFFSKVTQLDNSQLDQKSKLQKLKSEFIVIDVL